MVRILPSLKRDIQEAVPHRKSHKVHPYIRLQASTKNSHMTLHSQYNLEVPHLPLLARLLPTPYNTMTIRKRTGVVVK